MAPDFRAKPPATQSSVPYEHIPTHTLMGGLDEPKKSYALCFTVVRRSLTFVFSRSFGHWATLYFVAARPYGQLGTSTFIFSLKVAHRISARIHFFGNWVQFCRVFHICLVHLVIGRFVRGGVRVTFGNRRSTLTVFSAHRFLTSLAIIAIAVSSGETLLVSRHIDVRTSRL